MAAEWGWTFLERMFEYCFFFCTFCVRCGFDETPLSCQDAADDHSEDDGGEGPSSQQEVSATFHGAPVSSHGSVETA